MRARTIPPTSCATRVTLDLGPLADNREGESAYVALRGVEAKAVGGA